MPPPVSEHPSVVVVIPCFNHGRFVDEAVASCLKQIDADVRVVIVDDGSTDGTTPSQCDEAARQAPDRVRVVHQENRGLPAARNRGAAEADEWSRALGRVGAVGGVGADHDYLVFLDADDWIEPSFVTTLHAAITVEEQPNGGADISHAYCQERLVELGTGVWTVPPWDPLLLMITNLHPVTALVRTAWFRRVRGFDESMRDGYEDWDFWLKLAAAGGRGVRVREPLFIWRRHSADTMIHDAVARHEELFRRLVANHRSFYERHMPELLVRSNVLLRRNDANWLDENLDAIVLRDLRKWTEELVAERDSARAERDGLDRTLADERARLAGEIDAARREFDELRAMYEAKPVVRLSKKLHAAIEKLPKPVRSPLQSGIGSVTRRFF